MEPLMRSQLFTSFADMWDHNGDLTPRGLCATSAVGTAVVCLITFLLARLFSPMVCAQYLSLSRNDKRDWDTRYFSTFHASTVAFLSYLALVQHDTFYKESPVPVLFRTSYVTYLSLGLSIGHFIVELCVCLRLKIGGSAMTYHHVAALASVVWSGYSGSCHMPTLWMLSTEFTTPFINMRWWLDKAGLKAGKAYMFNGLAILVTWFFARILLFFFFYRELWRVRAELDTLDWPAQVLLLGVPLLLTFLNWCWFIQIIKGFTKIVVNFVARARASKTGGAALSSVTKQE